MDQDHTISKYDRLYGSSKLLGMMTKPSTIKIVEGVTGRSETFHMERQHGLLLRITQS